MTADSSRYPDRPAAWFVVTDQGLRLAGPYATRSEALAGRWDAVERLRASMLAERFTAAQIDARDRAVVVAWGVLVGPWQQFEAIESPPGTDDQSGEQSGHG